MNETINALVVLNYNDWKTTRKLIRKVEMYSTIDHILIVDNNSNDDSYLRLNELVNDKVDLLTTGRNGGYAYGNDYGCKYAIEKYDADYLIIANPDVMFSESTLKSLLCRISNMSDVGVVSCKMKCHSDIDLPEAWKMPCFCDCILENLMILRRLIGNRTRYKAEDLKSPTSQVDVIAGSFFVMPSDVYRKINGFDTNTFLYYEENILAQKIRQAGLKNYIFTESEYDHYHSVSINRTFSNKKKRFKLAEDSREYYAREYLKCGKVKMIFLKASFHIGVFNYLIADSVRRQLKKEHNAKKQGNDI